MIRRYCHCKYPLLLKRSFNRKVHINTSSHKRLHQNTAAQNSGEYQGPVGLVESMQALGPLQRLAVICSFTIPGMIGLYLIGDEEVDQVTDRSTNINGDSSPIASLQRFVRWCLQEVERERQQSRSTVDDNKDFIQTKNDSNNRSSG